ncbi:toll/interleukin-1 receptor domain-containing protein [Lentzea sp. NPDC051213]|uniref:toll/interleukin-1 receptor domain-containing protein n=1 Tax=Lentzea sp. NPDC051213 TaxID=3364126 RepID=UPI0037A8C4AA
MPKIFVSYSRQDFHAAEALTSVLAGHGVDAWLDVERLRPGTDWEIAINGAIDQADAVVVVASPAAMASRWVTEEWQRALRHGKRVHVALVRRTELPPELSEMHDLRGSFFRRARGLAEVLHGRAAAQRRAFPVSVQMALLWLALGYGAVIAGVGATLGWDIHQVYDHAGMSRLGLAFALTNAVGVAILSYLMVRLFRRTVSPTSLQEGLFAVLLCMVFSLIGTLTVKGRGDPAWPYLLAAALAVLGLLLLWRSRTVHLQMPTGKGIDHLRKGQRVRRRLRGFGPLWTAYQPRFEALKQAMPGVGATGSYRLWCQPEDKPLAHLITHACAAAGFVEDEVDPGWVFVVVTARTPERVIRNAHEVFGDRVVFVLATSLRLADDELRRRQWLDFREQDPEGLYEFLRVVVTRQPAERGVVTAPMGVDTFRAPSYVTGYLTFGRMMLGFIAAPALGTLIGGRFDVTLMLVTSALCAAVIYLMRGTAARSIDQVWWFGRTVLVLLLFAPWLFLAPNLPIIAPINRAALGLVMLMGLFFRKKPLLALWLPPDEGAKVAAPVLPPVSGFSLPLTSLVLATGYFWAVAA